MRSSVASGRAVRVERSSQNTIPPSFFFFLFLVSLHFYFERITTPHTHFRFVKSPLAVVLSLVISLISIEEEEEFPRPLSFFGQTTGGRGIAAQTI